MSIFIAGIAGFIGSNLAQTFITRGHRVLGFDNLRLGRRENLASLVDNPLFHFTQVDLTDFQAYRNALQRVHANNPITEVWHMAANSDIPSGVSDACVDMRDTFMTTFNTLELMKELGIKILAFASSSAIYGDLKGALLKEDIGPLFPISNYGAMKLASEAAISAAVESHIERAYIFRFPNVIGTPATHGVILDFVRKLKKTPDNLVVLGDGTQQKAYLHVDDLIEAMLFIRERSVDCINYFNIAGSDEGVTVRFIAEQVVAAVAPGASIRYGQGNKGWVGDVPKFSYSTDKLRGLGWQPRMNSRDALLRAIKQIVTQELDAS